jgi:hypothetical protein
MATLWGMVTAAPVLVSVIVQDKSVRIENGSYHRTLGLVVILERGPCPVNREGIVSSSCLGRRILFGGEEVTMNV